MAAYLARLTRASLLEVLRTRFVRSARARGLGAARVLLRHALPPALLPVVSYLGPAVAFIVTGSLVVETVFGAARHAAATWCRARSTATTRSSWAWSWSMPCSRCS